MQLSAYAKVPKWRAITTRNGAIVGNACNLVVVTQCGNLLRVTGQPKNNENGNDLVTAFVLGKGRKMAGKKSGGVVGFFLIGFLVLLASIPKEAWIVIGILALVGFLLYAHGKANAAEKSISRENNARAPLSRHSPAPKSKSDSVIEHSGSESTGYRIPSAPKKQGASRWYAPDEAVEVAGRKIAGGMIYVGTSLPCAHGTNDSCLIDPTKPASRTGDFTASQMGYWPSYSNLSKEARGSYLDWLADGRRHPEADIGYVFLFFYGLERRAPVLMLRIG